MHKMHHLKLHKHKQNNATLFLKKIKALARKDPKRIVYPESTEPRILKAIDIIVKEKIALPILVGEEAKIREAAKECHAKLQGVVIIDPNKSEKFQEYADKLYELRKHKGMTPEQAVETLHKYEYFATMMVYMGDADGQVSGAVLTTAQSLRPALQIIKTSDQYHHVSGLFLMVMKNKTFIFADCSMIPEPTTEELAQIAIDSANTAKKFGIEPKVAMLSFSTKGSAVHPSAEKVIQATELARQKAPWLCIDGEMQVDAAIVPEVCAIKCKDSPIKGDANVLIFPNVSCGNICYKLVERLAKANAIGPIIQGLAKPVNDLSRGCNVEDVVEVTAITVIEAQG